MAKEIHLVIYRNCEVVVEMKSISQIGEMST
jgi:hypothetical protein